MNEELQVFQSRLCTKLVSNIIWHLHNIAQDVAFNSTTSVERGYRCLQGAITTSAVAFDLLPFLNRKVAAELLDKEKIQFRINVGNMKNGLIKKSADASIDEIDNFTKKLKTLETTIVPAEKSLDPANLEFDGQGIS